MIPEGDDEPPPHEGSSREHDRDVLAERRARRAGAGEVAQLRRAETAEATVRALESQLADLRRRLQEAEREHERAGERLAEREHELRRVKQREYAEQQLRVEAEENATRLRREHRAELDRLQRRVDEARSAAHFAGERADERRARAEQGRLQAEQQRVEGEQQRVEAEQRLAQAEQLRSEGEQQRVETERRFVQAEQLRGEAEWQCAQAEQQRVQAERQCAAFAERLATVSESCTRMQQGVLALQSAATELRATVERERQTAERERQTAESERQAAQGERQAAESERQIAESERETAELRIAELDRDRQASQARIRELERSCTAADARVRELERLLPDVDEVECEEARREEMASALAAAVERLRARVAAVGQLPTPDVATSDVPTPDVATPEVATPEVATPEAPTPAPVLAVAWVVPRLLQAPARRVSWLAPAIRRVAERRDAKLAAELVGELLPAQGLVLEHPLSYRLAVAELDGVLQVRLGYGRGAVERVTGTEAVAGDFLLEGCAADFAELAAGGTSRRLAGLRVQGSRRRAHALRRARRRPLALWDLAAAGIDVWPGLLLLALAEAIDPRWCAGQRFTVAFAIESPPTQAPATLHVEVRDGEPLMVTRSPREQPAATVRLSERACMCMLAGAALPAGERILVEGDPGSLERLIEWADRAQGRSAGSASLRRSRA